MNKCCVPYCKSRKQKIQTFTVPKDGALRMLWDNAIQRPDRKLTIRDVVCEKHFNPECIVKEWKRRDCVIPLKNHRLRKDAIPCIFPKPPVEIELEPKRKLPNILKKPKQEQFILISSESESETGNSNDANNDNISTLSLENNTRLKPKLVCLNITKDNITVLPLQNNNSVLQLQTIPVGNTNQEISDAPVNRFQEQEPNSHIIVADQVAFFDFIWNSPLKLSSDTWSLVKVTSNKEKHISIGKYVLNDQGIPYAQRQVLLNEDLTIKYVINGSVIQEHSFLAVIQSLQQLEEAIFNVNSLKICTGGPSIEKYPLELYSYNKKKHVDTSLNVWRHNECSLIIPNNKSCTNCKKCKTLSTIFLAQTKTLDRQENKNKDQLIRRLKTKVDALKRQLNSHQFKSIVYNSTDDEDWCKMEEVEKPKNKVLEKGKIILDAENIRSVKELKQKKLRDKIDKWKELEWDDKLVLSDMDEMDLEDDDYDDEMDVEEYPQIISTMEDAHDNANNIEEIKNNDEMDLHGSSLESEKSADEDVEKSVLNSHRWLVVQYL